MGNLKPTTEQLKKANEDFTKKTKMLFDELTRLYSFQKPIVVYDLTTNKFSIEYEKESSVYMLQIKDQITYIRNECSKNLLNY